MNNTDIVLYISDFIHGIEVANGNHMTLWKTHELIINRNMAIRIEPKGTTPTYKLKRNGEIAVEFPRLLADTNIAIAQICFAVGKRIERYERGLKSNANRSIDSRKKIAQNAIQARWNANLK